MAGNVNRNISVGLDTSEAEGGINRLKQSGEELYVGIRDKAQAYSSKLDKQADAIQKLLDKEKSRIESLKNEKRVAIEMAAEQKISSIDQRRTEEDIGRRTEEILKDKKKALEDLNKEYRENKFVVEQAGKAADEDGILGTKRQESRFKGVAGRAGGVGIGMGAAMAGGAGAAAIIAGIPMVGGILSAWFNVAKEQEMAQYSLRAMTGRKAGVATVDEYGVSTGEFAAMQRQIAATRGIGGASLEGDVKQQIAAEKAVGMQRGQLTGLSRFERMGADSPAELMAKFVDRAANSSLWDIDVKNGKITGLDVPSLGEKMEALTQLMSAEAQGKENLGDSTSLAMLEAFSDLGGGFKDERGLARIMNINQSLKQGSNEFVQAEIMSALAAEDSSQSLLDVKLRQRQGVFGEGNLEAVLKRIKSLGTKESQMMALDIFTGEQLTREGLESMLNQKAGHFSGERGVERIKDMQAQFSVAAQTATGGLEKFDVDMKEMAGIFGTKISETLKEPLKAFGDVAIEFAKDPTQSWDKATDKMVDIWQEKVLNMGTDDAGADVIRAAADASGQNELVAVTLLKLGRLIGVIPENPKKVEGENQKSN